MSDENEIRTVSESDWRNGEVRPVRMVTVRADELRLGDHLDEGVRIVQLHVSRPPYGEGNIEVTTTSKVSSLIIWPPDHEVRVIRGEHWRPGLGLRGEHT